MQTEKGKEKKKRAALRLQTRPRTVLAGLDSFIVVWLPAVRISFAEVFSRWDCCVWKDEQGREGVFDLTL